MLIRVARCNNLFKIGITVGAMKAWVVWRKTYKKVLDKKTPKMYSKVLK